MNKEIKMDEGDFVIYSTVLALSNSYILDEESTKTIDKFLDYFYNKIYFEGKETKGIDIDEIELISRVKYDKECNQEKDNKDFDI